MPGPSTTTVARTFTAAEALLPGRRRLPAPWN